MLVAMAVSLGAVALGTWWSSLVLAKSVAQLSANETKSANSQIATQLDKLAPGTSKQANVQAAISQALKDPKITLGLANSIQQGSADLTKELSRLDSGLATLLNGNQLLLNVGEHSLASLARHLRQIAHYAFIASLALAGAALVISPLRYLVLRHLGFSLGVIGGASLLASWVLPSLVGHFAHGGVRSFSESVLSGGNPARTVVIECFAIGVGAYLATHLFELVGGSGFKGSRNQTPLRSGRVA
jgi:hypothetical protein